MPGFQDILGHETIKEHFKKAIAVHKVSHAYILAGEAGMGRKSLANAFALTLLCEKGQTEPCLECHACKQVLSGNHPDLIYVTHEKPASIGVDDIREQINDTIQIRPYSANYKIYIVDEAEKMTVQAQNALLKGTTGLCGHPIIDHQPGWISAYDFIPLRPVEVKTASGLHDPWLSDGEDGRV